MSIGFPKTLTRGNLDGFGHALFPRIPSRRVPAFPGRTVSAIHSQRTGRRPDDRIGRLHSGQGAAGLPEPLDAPVWQSRLDEGVELVKQKMRSGRLQNRIGQVQLFGRLLSTRHRPVKLAGRGRLVIPEGFREFLGVESGGEVQIVGAAVCIEIWNPDSWLKYLEGRMPRFRRLFDQLSQ